MHIKLTTSAINKSQVPLEKDTYLVYAFYLRKTMGAMIQIESLPSAPHFVPISEFTVVDQRISRYWVFPLCLNSVSEHQVISFAEWSNTDFFYDDVVNGYDAADIWRRYKQVMDLELAYNFPKKYLQPGCRLNMRNV